MSRPLILLVEDDKDTAALYNAFLLAEGMEVVCCSQRRQAQLWCQKAPRQPSLVVVDVGLPDGNGLQLCEELARRDNGLPCPPVLVISAHGDPRMPSLCRQAGAQGFLDKLVNMDQFVEKVKELIIDYDK